jgi:hypothetical protein
MRIHDIEKIDETWSKKYKKSIDCHNPKGFSQKAHCAGRKKRQHGEKTKSKSINESITNINATASRIKFIIESTTIDSVDENLFKIVNDLLEEHLLDENLHKWFKEKWVRFGPDGKIRGPCARGKSSEGKPKCLPLAKAKKLSKKKRSTAARRKRREDPNAKRKGSAHFVKTNESVEQQMCPHCGGSTYDDELLAEEKDACYYKVKKRYKIWPSAYASGALVQCRKKGAKNWGKSK